MGVNGKEPSKEKTNGKGLLGNIIDHHIQAMQFGQTNGIPQGSTLFDFIAEIILGYADRQLSLKLEEEGVSKYNILRYRDDYRIFSNSKDELEKIAFFLHEVLTDLNLQLNTEKTLLTEDVITDSIKKDKIWYVSNIPLFRKYSKRNKQRMFSLASCLQQEALYIHQFAKKYPNSGTLVKLLISYASRLRKKSIKCDEKVLISILIGIAMKSPKCYGAVLSNISILLQRISKTEEMEKIVNDIYTKFERLPNIGELQIWLQHITYQMSSSIEYTEPICKIVEGKMDVKIWNFDWVSDKYKEDFPIGTICAKEIRDKITPVIPIDEVSLFNEYWNREL